MCGPGWSVRFNNDVNYRFMRLQSFLLYLRIGGNSHVARRALIAALLVAMPVSRDAIADRPVAASLRPDVPLSEQLHREFDLDDGLPSSWINDVVQTRDDYAWIATDNGLVR